MRAIYAFALFVTAATGVSAQVLGGSTIAARTPQEQRNIEAQIFDALFKGIEMSAVQDSSARAVIHESVVKRDSLDATAASFRDQASALVQFRDARLRQFLQTERERSTFDANAKQRILIVYRVVRTP
jgi:hypothetical protein